MPITHKRVHSTTEEVPFYRFQRALREKRSLFREFRLVPPFQPFKDIFCSRIERTTDAYRKVSLDNVVFKINGADPHDQGSYIKAGHSLLLTFDFIAPDILNRQ